MVAVRATGGFRARVGAFFDLPGSVPFSCGSRLTSLRSGSGDTEESLPLSNDCHRPTHSCRSATVMPEYPGRIRLREAGRDFIRAAMASAHWRTNPSMPPITALSLNPLAFSSSRMFRKERTHTGVSLEGEVICATLTGRIGETARVRFLPWDRVQPWLRYGGPAQGLIVGR